MPFLLIIAIALVVVLISCYILYYLQTQNKQKEACYDAMLKMLLQPTPKNITALDNLLKNSYLTNRMKDELLHQAEVEADCVSIMPTGEIRSSQPFLQQRYNQILTTATSHKNVSILVQTRLTSFKTN